MKIVQKNEILEDMVKSTINVEVLGTATMTAEEEKGTVPTMPISPTGELSRLTW